MAEQVIEYISGIYMSFIRVFCANYDLKNSLSVVPAVKNPLGASNEIV